MSKTSLAKKAAASKAEVANHVPVITQSKRAAMPDGECISQLSEGLRLLHKTYFDGVRLVIEQLSKLEMKKVKADARTLPKLDPADAFIDTAEMVSQLLEDRVKERAELLLGKRQQRRDRDQKRKARGAKRA